MKKTYHIKGMTCKSCEVMLERDLKKINGINKVAASHAKGVVDVYSKDEIDDDGIITSIEKSGEYAVVDEHEKKKASKPKRAGMDYLYLASLFLLVGVIAWVLKEIEVSRFFPEFGGQINVFIAIMLGFVASISTCLALVGGIVMSFGETYPVHEDRKHPILSRLIPHLYFHVGRVGGFAVLGALLGLLGSKISYSVQFTGILTLIVAVVMLYIGLQVLGFLPNITRLGFALPKGLAHKIDQLKESDHHLMPIIIGVLTFFVPCGFTQSMQLAAVSSGSVVSGALIMTAFALGTMPVLLGVGFGSSYASKDRFGVINELIAIVIIFFALYSLNSGLVMAGSSFTLSGIGQDSTSGVSITDEVQVVKMDVDWSFQPNSFTIKKGVPVRWEINGINVSGCSNEVIVPKINLRKKIEIGTNIVEFTPEKTGTLPFSCWMGMLGGKFIVVD